MKVTTDRKDFAKALTLANKAVSRRCTLPVLSGVKITANGRLEVHATDLELTIGTSVPCLSAVDGYVVAPSRQLLELVKAQRSETVTLEADGQEMSVNGARMKILDSGDYPTLPSVTATADNTFTWDAQDLKDALGRVVIAASSDESRQVLTGVLLDGPSSAWVATDSYRLAMVETGHGNPGGKYLFPARFIRQVIKAIGKKTLEVHATFGDDQVMFTIDGSTFSTRLIEGEFPNYRQLIPAGYGNVLEAPKEVFLASLAQVAPMAQNNLPVKILLGNVIGGSRSAFVTISAHTPDVGEAEDTFPAPYQGEPMVVAFNPQFLADGIWASPGEFVRLELQDGLKPALLTATYCGGRFTYLLMPVRLS